MRYKVDTNKPQRGPLTVRPGSDQLYLTIYYPVSTCSPPDMVSGIQPSVARKKHLAPRAAAPVTSPGVDLPVLPPPKSSQFEVTEEEVSMAENIKYSTPYVNPRGPLPSRLMGTQTRYTSLFKKPVIHSTPIKEFNDSLVLASLSPLAPSPLYKRANSGGNACSELKRPRL